MEDVIFSLKNLRQHITDQSCLIYFLNSLSKILGKHSLSINIYNECREIYQELERSRFNEVQKRAVEYKTVLFYCDLSKEELKELFASVPIYVPKENPDDAAQVVINQIVFEPVGMDTDFGEKKEYTEKVVLHSDFELEIALNYGSSD